MKWGDKTEVKKSDYGESLIDAYLITKGLVPYKPDADRPHPFDRLCASSDKQKLYVVEVKTKAQRKYYPDTGFNVSSYNDYINIQSKYKLNVYVFFVDEELGAIYGGLLNYLAEDRKITHKGKEINYPLVKRGIIYFPVSAMRTIAMLNDSEISFLQNLTTKNNMYSAGVTL